MENIEQKVEQLLEYLKKNGETQKTLLQIKLKLNYSELQRVMTKATRRSTLYEPTKHTLALL